MFRIAGIFTLKISGPIYPKYSLQSGWNLAHYVYIIIMWVESVLDKIKKIGISRLSHSYIKLLIFNQRLKFGCKKRCIIFFFWFRRNLIITVLRSLLCPNSCRSFPNTQNNFQYTLLPTKSQEKIMTSDQHHQNFLGHIQRPRRFSLSQTREILLHKLPVNSWQCFTRNWHKAYI